MRNCIAEVNGKEVEIGIDEDIERSLVTFYLPEEMNIPPILCYNTVLADNHPIKIDTHSEKQKR